MSEEDAKILENIRVESACDCFLADNDDKKDCRMWIDYPKDFNCTLCSIERHGKLTLEQISERIGVTTQRVGQLEAKALGKIRKRYLNKRKS